MGRYAPRNFVERDVVKGEMVRGVCHMTLCLNF